MAFNTESRRHLGLQPLPGMLIQMTPFFKRLFYSNVGTLGRFL